LYGTSKLWWVFAQRNLDVIQDPVFDFIAGTQIFVPKKSGLVSILPLKLFSDRIKNQFVEYDEKFINFSFTVQYCKWHRGSYIPWHNDSDHSIGATIYLNKDWDVEDGGLFVYSETGNVDNLKCIYPCYNTLVINESNEWHHVSLVNYHANTERTTIQIWIEKNQSKKINYS
jgi:hypothetical protein